MVPDPLEDPHFPVVRPMTDRPVGCRPLPVVGLGVRLVDQVLLHPVRHRWFRFLY